MYEWVKHNNMRDFYCNIMNFCVLFLKHYAADSSSDLQHMCCGLNVQGCIYTDRS